MAHFSTHRLTYGIIMLIPLESNWLLGLGLSIHPFLSAIDGKKMTSLYRTVSSNIILQEFN